MDISFRDVYLEFAIDHCGKYMIEFQYYSFL